jgi:hypothetical protein
MGIAHAASTPPWPGAPSFLDLPAEIRNAVYELLFKRGRRVYMPNIHAYHTKMPRPDYYPDDSEYDYEFEEDYEDTTHFYIKDRGTRLQLGNDWDSSSEVYQGVLDRLSFDLSAPADVQVRGLPWLRSRSLLTY